MGASKDELKRWAREEAAPVHPLPYGDRWRIPTTPKFPDTSKPRRRLGMDEDP